MNFLTKTIRPQFLNKRIAYRAICSSPFTALSSHRSTATTNWPTTDRRCQQHVLLNASPMFHDKFPSRIDFCRSFSSNAVVLTSNGGNTFVDKLRKFIGAHKNSKSNLRRAACLLFEKTSNEVDYRKFMEHFQMENTFYSWFLINSLHVYMLMVRSMGEREREHGLLVRNQIVQSMWDDVGFRAKKLGPGNRKSIKKQISQLADHFEYSLFAYDEGITSDDKQLASTIWTQFFNKNCDDYVQVELMVKYIRANIAMLDNLSSDEFLHRRTFKWIDLLEV